MQRTCGCLSLLLAMLFGLATMPATAADRASEAQGKLRIYFIDAEGGQATLFVTPNGHSLLIDTGWAGYNNRDADRIAAAARRAGIARLDYVLITHYHGDHVGGVSQLVANMPVGTFLDHGPNREQPPVLGWQSTKSVYEAYQSVLATGKYRHMVLHAGEKLPLKDLDATVVTADGAAISQPLPGAGASNPTCGDADKDPEGFEDPDMSENGRALAVVFKFGGVRILDPGDLTWDRERMLMCPVNKLGHIDLFIVGNHGMAGATSPALVYGIAPQVVIMDNGATKGGGIPALDLIRNAPNKPVLWQLHYAQLAGAEHNTEAPLIANLDAPQGKGPTQVNDRGYMLEVSVDRDGHFTVFNERTQETRVYQAQ
jgi:beta-lactamase superfamily II metal-dependent hydrolase